EGRARSGEEVAGALKLIVGLGNPGSRYRATRHNVGFAVADEVARRASLEFEAAPVDALIARWRRARFGSGGGAPDDQPPADVLIAKPVTFMNESGNAVGALLRYFRIELNDVLVVVDDVQLPLGRLRARARGSAGGHNGLKSIIAHVGD